MFGSCLFFLREIGEGLCFLFVLLVLEGFFRGGVLFIFLGWCFLFIAFGVVLDSFWVCCCRFRSVYQCLPFCCNHRQKPFDFLILYPGNPVGCAGVSQRLHL